MSAVAVSVASAAPFNVTSTLDAVDATPGDGVCATAGAVCTLRAAVQEANAWPGADTITLLAGIYTLTLGGPNDDVALTGDLDITQDLTLTGAGASATFIDGNAADRVFDIFGGVTATLSMVTIRNGNGLGNKGGGLRNVGTLTLADSVLANNTDGNEGGGIWSSGAASSLTITSSTLSGNTVPGGKGGGIFIEAGVFSLTDVSITGGDADEGGGLRNFDGTGTLTGVTISGNTAATGGGFMNRNTAATMTLTNVTVSGNSATDEGGGIQQQGNTLTLTNVTVAGNSSVNPGGNIRNKSGTTQMQNTIVADSGTGGDCAGTINSLGYNLDTDGTCGLGGVGDISSGTPLLGPLAANGGATQTHALQIGSDAIDAVAAGCPPPAVDQRAVARPVDGDGDTVAFCDMGAYESDVVPTTLAGTVYEDINGDSLLGDAVGASGVMLRLYTDANDNGAVDAGDVFLSEKTSDAGGTYVFLVDPGATGNDYLIAVSSVTAPPVDGFNGGFAQGDVWAEQTYGDDPSTPALDLGTRLGGGAAGTSDDVDPASTDPADNTYQHLARVDVSGGSVSGVNFAFSFRVVTHVGDADDDLVANRTAQGSLRQLILNANAIVGAPTLAVPAGTYTLAIAGTSEDAALTGDLDVTDGLTLNGAGASSTIVDGGLLDRIFELQTGVTATVTALAVRNGDAGNDPGGGILSDGTTTLTDILVTASRGDTGGGVYSSGASLTLTDSTLSGNTADDQGGGFADEGALATLERVTISGNTSNGHAGGILSKGTTLNLTNVTLSGNLATSDGGAMRAEGGGTTTLVSVTMTANQALGNGSGLRRSSGTVDLQNTIVADNIAGTDCDGSFVSSGYNLDGDGSCGLGGVGDISSGTANLGPLADNGGSTETHALLFGSDAIDAVVAGCPPPATDQRGIARPIDGDGDLTATCDMGAYEAGTATTVSGTVYEDVNGDAGLGDAVAAGNVRVRLYEDVNDSGLVDAGDTFVGETTTNATTGVYSFGIGSGTNFLVAVDSKTVPPDGGFNGGFGQTDIWAEQTYGDDPATPALDLGARLGGGAAGTSDDVDAASTDPADNAYQHLARIDVSGGSVTGVDFALSFRAVSHVGDADDDPAANRTAQGSLRQLIQNANAIVGAPTLDVPAGTYTLSLTGAVEDVALTGDLDVTDDVTLAGASPASTVIDGNRTDRVFDVLAATVQLSGLTVEKGDAQGDHGGGILINAGSTLTVVDSMVRDNDGDRGGGIRVDGDLVMSGSTLYGNRGSQGGAIQASGSTETVTLTNVTISGNDATSRGGGVELDPSSLTNVTITGNTSADGGGIYRKGGQPFTVANTIIAGNPSGGDCTNLFTSAGYNLDGDGSCGLSGPGDISSGTANLGLLADNGGPTLTHALLAGSDAIDAVVAGCPPPATDQRGVGRPVGTTCDIGAYEGALYALKIVKRAFQSGGTPIASGSTLPAGMPVKFMLYINNPGGLAADVSMRDVLDPLFLYVAGSIKYDDSVATCALIDCTVVEEAAIFAAVDSGTVGTDDVDGDVVSFTGVTLDAGNQNAANAQLDIPGGKVWAVVFTIRMQ